MRDLLKAWHVTMRFGGLTALDAVDLTVGSGQVVGLIGPNGSGKTTFLNLLSGVYTPTWGELRFAGRSLVGLRPHQVFRLGIARTFQNSRLFWQLNVLENVMAGMVAQHPVPFWGCALNTAAKREAEDRLRRKALDILAAFNWGLYAQAGKPAHSLAYADRRRLEICRAVASRPKLLLLDEPSAGMDPAETAELMEDLAAVKRMDPHLSLIIIEHDMSVIETLADRVVVFNQGRKIAEGPYAQVSADPEVVAAYLGGEAAC